MTKTQLSVSGMHCASCATILTKALNKVPGVTEATVNYSTERAVVSYDPQKTGVPAFINAIKANPFCGVHRLDSRNACPVLRWLAILQRNMALS